MRVCGFWFRPKMSLFRPKFLQNRFKKSCFCSVLGFPGRFFFCHGSPVPVRSITPQGVLFCPLWPVSVLGVVLYIPHLWNGLKNDFRGSFSFSRVPVSYFCKQKPRIYAVLQISAEPEMHIFYFTDYMQTGVARTPQHTPGRSQYLSAVAFFSVK